ncbi:uncharacterized protein LOC131433989 [Malaya genurostris]|uniref:uncharacterized protein LOC131433989 n=1 Tax=Malaya genurostris TaxID=325434 RepID=UPI0026F3B029|nr:uncharacterized protein LOC131433989 [Malaya genurostris]
MSLSRTDPKATSSEIVSQKLGKHAESYDKWRNNNIALRELELQHQKENDIRRKRELVLIEKIKSLEVQREQYELDRQRREAELKSQWRNFQEVQEIREQQQQLIEKDNELRRVHESEEGFRKQLNQLIHQGQLQQMNDEGVDALPILEELPETLRESCTLSKTLPHLNSNKVTSDQRSYSEAIVSRFNEDWYNKEIEKLHHCRRQNAETESNFSSASQTVISTLQILYGRPEQIVQNLIMKVRTTPAPKVDKMDSLISFGLVVQNLCGHLKAVGLDKHLSNPMLLQELVEKLPATVKFNWALYQQQLTTVDLSSFSEYMAKVASATSSVVFVSGSTAKLSREETKGRQSREKVYVNAHSVDQVPLAVKGKQNFGMHREKKTDITTCPVCGGENHQASNCATFKKLTIDDRWSIVKDRKLCRRCLTPHTRWPCRGEMCGINSCHKRHHRLLHYDQPNVEFKSKGSTSSGTVTIHRQISSSTLFRILPVTLFGCRGQVNTFAFLDDGSSVTLVEKAIADTLGVHGKPESLCIQWTSGINKKYSNTERVNLDIAGMGSKKRLIASDVYIVEHLGLPEQTLNYDEMAKEYNHLRGLPISSFQCAVPGILIGLSNTHLLATLKLREGRLHEPIAAKTRIGWAVFGNQHSGKFSDANNFTHRQMHICSKTSDDDLHKLVRGFFSVDSLGVVAAPTVESLDDQRARKILQDTTVRTKDGRFSTGLLWKHDFIEFPDSRPMAVKRLICLEKRLTKNPQLYDNVRQQINDFQQKGYAHKATADELSRYDPLRTWYLPLGVVLSPRKPGKVRLIWDAAAKVNGVSLNTKLLKGPDLLTPLLSVLFQYRQRKVAICADIKEMFHQILIREEDRSAQLFLWRDDKDSPMETMVTDVAIFGATCSPAQSQYVKNLNASENESNHPRAAEAIKYRHYVDDYLESVDTADEAVELALEVTKVHAKAGFLIRNWISNERSVMEKIGEVNPTTVKIFVGNKETDSERLLGLIWRPEEDAFSFSLTFREETRRLIEEKIVPTKRELLRVVMSLYDPLGLIAAFVIHGKIIMQEVWRSRTDWDERIPENLFLRWKQWLVVLKIIERINIPRCYFPGYSDDGFDSLGLHVFVDASEQAYAAVAYLRMVDRTKVRCVLVASKTKVAPLQALSIPKLELQAAVLGARLRKTIEEKHTLHIKHIFCWTDSSTVMSWIQSDLRRYRPYVAFRVNEILSLSSIREWRWVPTRLNVADEATKWGKGPSFDPKSRWYRGPEFLYDAETEWPKDCRKIEETEEELRPAFVFTHHVINPAVALGRFSKWERLLRCIAYVHRYIGNCRRANLKVPRETGVLTSEELKMAERSLWRVAQSEEFLDEVAILKRNQQKPKEDQRPLERNSTIAHATPALDEFEIMRVDGRTENADYLSYDAKYPIILPKNHRVTKLLLDWYHRKFRHANEETVLNEIKQRFYIPRLRFQLFLKWDHYLEFDYHHS